MCFLGVVFGLVLGVGFSALETLHGPNLGPFWGSYWSLFGTFLGAALASSFKIDLRCDFHRFLIDLQSPASSISLRILNEIEDARPFLLIALETDSGSTLGRFSTPNSAQNRSRESPEGC